MLVGGIEAGGTKFVCAVGNENNELLERVAFRRLRLKKHWRRYLLFLIVLT